MSRLPVSLDPWRAAEQGMLLEGSIALADLPRIADLLAVPEGNARFRLEFFYDTRHRACVRGRVQAEVPLVCQRCLEPVAIAVDAQVLLAAVAGYDEAAKLPDEYDPLLVEEQRIAPTALVEDEIILALPNVPRHPPGQDCRSGPNLGSSTDACHPEERGDNPFQVLSVLKKPVH